MILNMETNQKLNKKLSLLTKAKKHIIEWLLLIAAREGSVCSSRCVEPDSMEIKSTKWGVFHFVALGITLHCVTGRYVTGLPERSASASYSLRRVWLLPSPPFHIADA